MTDIQFFPFSGPNNIPPRSEKRTSSGGEAEWLSKLTIFVDEVDTPRSFFTASKFTPEKGPF